MAKGKPPGQPQKLLVPCPHCHLTVLRGTYHSGAGMEKRWEKHEPPLMPVSGNVHDCDVAVALELRAQGLRWRDIFSWEYVGTCWRSKSTDGLPGASTGVSGEKDLEKRG